MARLRVRLRGKNTQEIQLDPERAYLAGRRDDCDIVLLNEKGISREHFRLHYTNTNWQLEVLSQYGDVLYDGEKIQQVALEGQKLFYLGPYEFEYTETSSDLVPMNSAKTPAPLFSQAFAEAGEPDRTFIGASNNVPFIKVVDDIGDVKELFKLDGGDTWVAGRDSSCDIMIRDQRVSRRQFEVRRSGSQFLIMDLGSVNGTLLNGNPVSSTDPMLLKSGDAISVLNNHLYFELHDPDFKARMELVKANAPNPLVAASHDIVPAGNQYPPQMTGYGYPPMPAGAGGYPPDYESGPKKFDFEKHRVKIIAGAVVLLAVAYLFSGSDQGPKPGTQPGAVVKPQEAFKKLTPEQQILVKQTYQLSKNLYMQGKYELAKAEVAKIYELVPEYEDSKDIERLANEALIIQQQKVDQELKEKERLEREEKIASKVAECKEKLTPNTTMNELDECIRPVVEFDPNNAAFAELRAKVEEYVAQKQMRDTQKAEYQGQVQKLKGMFNRAESTQRENQYLKAIKEYQSVVNSSLPDPSELKSQARKQIASIQATLKQKTDQYGAEAEQAYKDQKLKESILTLRKSMEVDPTNDDTPDKIARYTTELKKQMMVLYQEGILEESYGNVEGSENKPGAKDKWKKIMDLDIPDGEYYGKAKIKLKKYGAL
jgi:pSer/pThr/pTyr-binding forkhead associated (FHA) protein